MFIGQKKINLILSAGLLTAGQLSPLVVCAEGTSAKNSPKMQMMGVSSAWNYSEQPVTQTRTEAVPAKAEHTLSAKVKHNSSSSLAFSEKTIENQLDIWQKQFKEFCNTVTPRVVAFSNWAAKKIGFAKKPSPPIPNLQMAGTSPSIIKVHIQPVSTTHQAWLMRDGRLKTVAAK